MAPVPAPHGEPQVYFSPIKTQWENPTDILSILMIIGGDVVQRAIAQLAGPGPGPLSFTPVAFSFGWVAYALNALLSAVGDGRLLPSPESDAILVNAQNGYLSKVKSWPLSRLIRDHKPQFDTEERDQRQTLDSNVGGRSRNSRASESNKSTSSGSRRSPISWISHTCKSLRIRSTSTHDTTSEANNTISQNGLHITFYDTLPDKCIGSPDGDWVYYLSLLVITTQLVISIVPVVLHGNWMILIITAGGTVLALCGGALPQWQAEKWKARELHKDEIVCLTGGNGSQSVMVITSKYKEHASNSLRLADLANGRDARLRSTEWATIALFILWLVLLLTVEGLEADAWYSLALGALGMIQNVVVAGAERSPGALGFHLERRVHVHDEKVFKSLQKAEKIQRGAGISLIPVFFPGGLRPDEKRWLEESQAEYAANDVAARNSSASVPKVERLPSTTTLVVPSGAVSMNGYESRNRGEGPSLSKFSTDGSVRSSMTG
ncbi:hypothetical protein OBBRIDRAFT_799275 [Obba rivulosa]|uniref:Uncharacterized protein n=1 Tax=Obba rivulosa TaxID=1052685 RepID=A0A8E2AP72_9APHY|nr:hypothetical protein OBBRIDRAFT_799275 [Obba rivulosa]